MTKGGRPRQGQAEVAARSRAIAKLEARSGIRPGDHVIRRESWPRLPAQALRTIRRRRVVLTVTVCDRPAHTFGTLGHLVQRAIAENA